MSTFETSGFDRVASAMAKLAFPAQFFDRVFAKTARQSTRDLITATPKKTGALSKVWTSPKKLGDSNYLVTGKSMTADGKHNIITLVDQGRGWVYPKKAKKLFIPLSNKGRAKPYGVSPSSIGLKFGKDYVLSKKSRPSKPAKFIEPVVNQASKRLVDDMLESFNRMALGA